MLLNLTVQYVRHPHSSLLYILFLWWELRALWGCNFWHYHLFLGTRCYPQYTEEKLQLFKVIWTSQIRKEKCEKMFPPSALAKNIFIIKLQTNKCKVDMYLWARILNEQERYYTCMEPLWSNGSTKLICFERGWQRWPCGTKGPPKHMTSLSAE